MTLIRTRTRTRTPTALALAALLLVPLLSLSCDDSATRSASCVVDADCEGLEVCSGEICTAPDDNVSTQNNGNNDPPDAGPVEDIGADGVAQTADAPVMEDVPAMPDVSPGNPCLLAEEHIISCYPTVTPQMLAQRFDVQWPACLERDLCVAECAVGLSCGALTCDFDPDVDCDGIGALAQCVVDTCQSDAAGAVNLCTDTGGQWGNGGCECCDGPVACGTNPADYCLDACCGPPQCYCPNDAPFWTADRGCVAAGACP